MDFLNSKDASATLSPSIMKIGNCQFRRQTLKSVETKQFAPYLDNDDDKLNCVELDDEVEVKLTKSGNFLTQFYVPPSLFSALIGVKGSKKRQIEADTDCHIKIPRQGETGEVVITGPTERNVVSARTRVNMFVLYLREKIAFTHFLSVPVVSKDIAFNFETFKNGLLNGPPQRGVDETLFQNPARLHLTITPLVLLDDFERDLAVNALSECKSAVIEPLFKNAERLRIVMRGVEIMNDDPTNVDVLYGKVELNETKYNSNFRKMADQMLEVFSKKGLVRKQYESVKLHVTLMNSLFRRGESNDDVKQGKGTRESFDATYALKNYKTYLFGEAEFNSVHLSIRFTTSQSAYYEALTTIDLK